MRRILFILICLLFVSNYAYSMPKKVWVNDLRTLFIQNKAIIMAVNPRTMGAEDKDGNEIIEFEKGEISGNFLNAIPRLKEFKNLGINTIHILPITPVGQRKAMGTAGSLYSLNGFDSINPQLDDKKNPASVYEEAKLFISEAHKLGIRVIVDLPSCGSYDLYLTNPQLFLTDENSNPIIPSDWKDVRVFKNKDENGNINQELYELHKKFIDMILDLNVDGIRADVATIKPYDFWANLIEYTRKQSPEFLFLAEACPLWKEKVCKQCDYTLYNKLLEAGFDGYYGTYVDYISFKTSKELKQDYDILNNYFKKTKEKKAVIAAFTTHDILSPLLTGGVGYASQIAWLSTILPANSYFVDGFQTLDKYIYSYSNKKAQKSYTDDEYYYVHRGKMDIFNFSRKPKGENNNFLYELSFAIRFKLFMNDLISMGDMKIHRTNNSEVYAFSRTYNNVSVVVILNKVSRPQKNVITIVKGIDNSEKIVPIRVETIPTIEKSKIKSSLKPYEIQVIVWDRN